MTLGAESHSQGVEIVKVRQADSLLVLILLTIREKYTVLTSPLLNSHMVQHHTRHFHRVIIKMLMCMLKCFLSGINTAIIMLSHHLL